MIGKGIIDKISKTAASRSGQTALMAILFLAILVMFVVLMMQSETFAGGGDTITHYLFARYSWQNPAFLLDHWAKPLFTLLASPFAQFGLRGVVLMNIMIGLASAWLAWSLARNNHIPHAWLIPFLTVFNPVVTDTMLSGLTEIMFGGIIILSIWLFDRKRYGLASLVIGFSFLIRTEGIFLIPAFALFLLIAGKTRHILWMGTATLLYSVAGYFHYKDLFWLISYMPYKGATDLYGTGPILYFVTHAPAYFGPAIVFLVLAGLLSWFAGIRKNLTLSLSSLWMVCLCLLIYFSAHSLMWFSGIGNSLGLYRYMAATGPLVAIVSLLGINALKNWFRKIVPGRKWIMISSRLVFGLMLLWVLIRAPFNLYPIPLKLHGPDLVVKQAADYIIKQDLISGNMVYYYDPAFVVHLNLNPFSGKQARERIYFNSEPCKQIEPGSLVIWDAHFSVNNGLESEALLTNPCYELLGEFRPESHFTVFGRDYLVRIFRRMEENQMAP